MADYPVLFVGVHCCIDELERREKVRGDRNIGQARRQLEYVHKGEIYDIELNTDIDSIEEISNKVIEALIHEDFFTGWSQTYKKIGGIDTHGCEK